MLGWVCGRYLCVSRELLGVAHMPATHGGSQAWAEAITYIATVMIEGGTAEEAEVLRTQAQNQADFQAMKAAAAASSGSKGQGSGGGDGVAGEEEEGEEGMLT